MSSQKALREASKSTADSVSEVVLGDAAGGGRPEVPNKPSLVVKVASHVTAEAVEQGSCRSLPFTVCFWVLFMVTQVGHRQVRLQNSMQQALTSTLRAKAVVGGSTNLTVTGRRLLSAGGSRSRADTVTSSSSQGLDDVTDVDGILRWLYSSLVPQLWSDAPFGRGTVLDFNRAVGGVRIQQYRLASKACPGSAAVRKVYNLTCYNGEPEVLTAADMAALPGLRASEGGLQTYWLDLASDLATVQAQIESIWDVQWFSPASSGIWVQCVLLNAQVELIAYSEVEFFLDRVGRTSKYTKVFTLPTEVYGTNWLIWSGDSLMLILLLCLLAAELVGLCSALQQRSLKKYCRWLRILNWLVLTFGTGFSVFYGYLSSQLEALSADLAALPQAPAQAAAVGSAAWQARHAAMDAVYDEVARLSGLLRSCELAAFWYSLILLLKFSQAFQGNPRLALITTTLRESSSDVAHFLVVFVVVFLTFALSAYFLFGHQIEEWSNMIVACNTAYRALMGDFDFKSMYAIAPVSSVVWFWLFMALMFLVMLNMLLAIILDHYTKLKDRTTEQSTLFQQLATLQRRFLLGLRAPALHGQGPDSHDELVSLVRMRPDGRRGGADDTDVACHGEQGGERTVPSPHEVDEDRGALPLKGQAWVEPAPGADPRTLRRPGTPKWFMQ